MVNVVIALELTDPVGEVVFSWAVMVSVAVTVDVLVDVSLLYGEPVSEAVL